MLYYIIISASPRMTASIMQAYEAYMEQLKKCANVVSNLQNGMQHEITRQQNSMVDEPHQKDDGINLLSQVPTVVSSGNLISAYETNKGNASMLLSN